MQISTTQPGPHIVIADARLLDRRGRQRKSSLAAAPTARGLYKSLRLTRAESPSITGEPGDDHELVETNLLNAFDNVDGTVMKVALP
jgi:hypothetical protein